MIPNSFSEDNITLIPKQIRLHEKKQTKAWNQHDLRLQIKKFLTEIIQKHLQNNNTPWTSGLYSRDARIVQ
jgi:hypothetical protein